MPKITIKVIGADNALADSLGKSITEQDGYKYTYLKQLVSRLRIVKSNVKDAPEEERIVTIGNALVTERNIANFAAEQYAMLNQEDLFNSFMEIVSDIEELLK